MPKIRQTNKVMKVGNQWLPAFLNSVNGSPTYTYMNDSGQWADASGNTYSVVQPLDEVTVKYDPKTGGQINKAAPDYWRQYGQRRMQQTAGNVDKVIMGTVGAATAPLWLPEIYGAGLVLGGNPAVQQFTNQVLYGLGADAALKATTGYDYSEAGQRLFSPVLQKIGLSQGMSNTIGQLTGGVMNPGYYIPTMKLNAQKILDPVADYLVKPFSEYSKKLWALNDAVYPTIGTIAGGAAGNQLSEQNKLPEYMKPYAEPLGMLIGGGIGSQLKRLPNMYGSYVTDMLRYPVIAPYEMARGNYVFGSKTKAMLKRAQQESKYFNTAYDDLTDKYINKDVYPGFGDIKPNFKMKSALNGDVAAYYNPNVNTVVTPMFKGSNTRISFPFDVYRKGTILHEATHALHNRANKYSKYLGGGGAVTKREIVANSMKPLATRTSSYYEMNPVLRHRSVYRTHYDNVKNTNVDPDFKTWMSNPEEWHSEYNNIISRVADGSVVPVSDLTRNQRDIAINYFMKRFGVNVKQAGQALDMIGAYQRDFLQGARVHITKQKPYGSNVPFSNLELSYPPTLRR